MVVASIVNVHEAKSRLSQLLEQVERGEEVTIARAGKPVARLVAIRKLPKRKLGMLEGRIEIPDSIDKPLPKGLLKLFESKT